jgi:hypothetical protein
MWKKIAIVSLLALAIKVAYDFFMKKMEEKETDNAEKIPEDGPDVTIKQA